MSSEIKPRIEDGEPVCSGEMCPHRVIIKMNYDLQMDPNGEVERPSCPSSGYMDAVDGDICIPGLRAQRDEARRDFCCATYDNLRANYDSQKDVAASRGWSCLYTEEQNDKAFTK